MANNSCKLVTIVSACMPGQPTCIAILPLQLLLFWTRRPARTSGHRRHARLTCNRLALLNRGCSRDGMYSSHPPSTLLHPRSPSVNAVISPPEGYMLWDSTCARVIICAETRPSKVLSMFPFVCFNTVWGNLKAMCMPLSFKVKSG